ncbi:putative fasciculation and elongation protein zeta-2-like [Scophthalmus maximus]|uniref:Putative fasciculation and elongation protein zeta-2-like n=1 Tax=Scophthalmus maximus TaxID=52904 RepID=A0A2U9CUQ8_SCOMX|nr:putative fasciculation and elongation protein zeta-2-like [Scophthalmus maximus]
MAAPLAHFDEDWQDFNEFKPASASASADRLDLLNCNVGDSSSGLDDLSDLDNSFSGEICSFRSMEDLVHDFDEKLTVCFRNYSAATENIAPVRPISEDGCLKDDEVWNSLTDNYGNVMPVDWKTSHTRSLHLPTLNLTEHEKLDNQSLDLSDDEELREQMDMHSIIVSCISDEPLFTAEQVIEEIEEMMQESPDPEDDESPSQSEMSMLSQDLHALKRSASNTSYEDLETSIRRYSEELIQALALRDELEYEKEVKNSFISLLIDVQNRQKEHRELLRKKKKIRSTTTTAPNGQRTVSTHIPGTYLTTVIPYEKNAGSTSVEDLQILTKILHAMRDDSERVPALLTDYILKVLCPT